MTNITIPRAEVQKALDLLERGDVLSEVQVSNILRAALSQAETAEPQPVATANEVQWRNIKKVVRALADLCFGSPNDPKYGHCHVALTTSLTAKDGIVVELEPLPVAQQPQKAEAAEPLSVADAERMGATGGPVVEGERLAFEAWMRGHCWALSATWRGTQYKSDAEEGGDLDPRAMATRRLWAAWRDRAALAVVAQQPQEHAEQHHALAERSRSPYGAWVYDPMALHPDRKQAETAEPAEPDDTAIRAAVLAERERCAKAAEAEHAGQSVVDMCTTYEDDAYNTALRDAAAAIRKAPDGQQAETAELEADAARFRWIPVTEQMPNPGNVVLAAYKNRCGNWRRIRARWIPAKTVESDGDSDIGEYDEATDAYYDPEGWYECMDNWDEYAYIVVTHGDVTHWMPLPEAPAIAKEQT